MFKKKFKVNANRLCLIQVGNVSESVKLTRICGSLVGFSTFFDDLIFNSSASWVTNYFRLSDLLYVFPGLSAGSNTQHSGAPGTPHRRIADKQR